MATTLDLSPHKISAADQLAVDVVSAMGLPGARIRVYARNRANVADSTIGWVSSPKELRDQLNLLRCTGDAWTVQLEFTL